MSAEVLQVVEESVGVPASDVVPMPGPRLPARQLGLSGGRRGGGGPGEPVPRERGGQTCPSLRTPNADLQMENLGIRADAAGLHQPLVHSGGDIATCGLDAAGEVGGVEAAGLGEAVGAFLGVVGTLGNVAGGLDPRPESLPAPGQFSNKHRTPPAVVLRPPSDVALASRRPR